MLIAQITDLHIGTGDDAGAKDNYQRLKQTLETLATLQPRPDLVIAIRRYTEKDGDQIEAIAPMLALDLITVQDSLRGVELAGQALGAPAKASALNTRFLDRVQLLADRNEPKPAETVALLTSGSETPFVYYDHFLPTGLLERLGEQNYAQSQVGTNPNHEPNPAM